MSSPKRRPKRSRSQSGPTEPTGSLSDIIGISLLLVGIVHILSLVTYTPGDLPASVSFSSQATPNSPAENIIGPLGAIIAGYTYFIFGAASYLIPTGLLWFGATKLFAHRTIPAREIVGLAIFVVSGACLCHFQPFFFTDWKSTYNILGSGGAIGYGLGEQILMRVIGTGGSVIVMAFAYFTSIILLTGIHPVVVLKMAKASFAGIRAGIDERRIARAEDAEERAALEEKRLEREQAKTEKAAARARKKAASRKPSVDPLSAAADDLVEEEDELDPVQELPLDLDAPQPKIIDGTARRSDTTADGKKKPTLAELRAKRREKEQATAKKNSTQPSALADAFRDYDLPELDLLDFTEEEERKPTDRSKLLDTQNVIVKTLSTFGITVTPGDITRGPTITRYEIYPGEGLRVSRIVNLEADIARATKAERINIIAPIPGKDTVGIEIANIDKVPVPLRELLEDEVFTESKAKLPLALGKDVYGNTIVADLASMPHLLVAGATGSGKSVCINSIIASLLFQFTPDQLRFIMIDPKVVEMQSYNSLPHLVIPVVTDPKKVLLALRWVVNEMERRYKVFAQVGVRNFEAFNKRDPSKGRKSTNKNAKTSSDLGDIPGSESPDPALAAEELHTCAVKIENGVKNDHAGATDATPPPRDGEDGEDGDDFYNVPDSYPYIVVIIDELADLMQTAPADVEMAIARITQMARAAGIHLIVATQTPRADVITGVIKANIPCRIAFQVSSALDSRVILDSKGADKLVGKGDMLYLPPGTSQLVRSQGAFLSDEEIFDIVRHCSEQAEPVFESDAQAVVEGNADADGEDDVSDEDEETLEKCLDIIAQEGKASTSLLQRRLRLGYTRAARMIDILESRGIIGPGDGARPREILVDLSDPIG